MVDRYRRSLFAIVLLSLAAASTEAQVGHVRGEQKIAEGVGGFASDLPASGLFGGAVATLGDLDQDAVTDIAAGAQGDNAVFVLRMNADGTVKAEQRIGENSGGFIGPTYSLSSFGGAVASLGDLDHDGIPDLAVTDAPNWDLWILFLNADGTVKAERKNRMNSARGRSMASLGDLDGDGITDLALGEPDHGPDTGTVWISFLNANGSVRATQRIGSGTGGFGLLEIGDRFGRSLAALGDLDGDGITDLAVGAAGDFFNEPGELWILLLNADGTSKAAQRINATMGGFGGALAPGDDFGSSLAGLGDLDGDSIPDLAVGASGDDDGGVDQGAVWLLFLKADGRVKRERKISETAGGFGSPLAAGDFFGSSLASLGDLDGDGGLELIVGSMLDDQGGFNSGALWTLFLQGPSDPYGQGTPIPPGEGVGRDAPRLLIVDDDIGANAYGSIQEAVNKARDGDVVLVRADFGSPHPVVIADKSLVLISEAAPSAVLSILVRDLDAEGSFALRGFRARLELRDCAGPILIEDCILGTTTITNCAEVGFSRVVASQVGSLSPTVSVTDSTLFAYDTELTGTHGSDAYIDDSTCDSGCSQRQAYPGTDALALTSSQAYLFRSTLQGGDGGYGAIYSGFCDSCDSFFPDAPGGSGLELTADSAVVHLECVFLAGRNASGAVHGTGTLSALGAEACDYTAAAPVGASSPALVTFTGKPGNSVFLTYADRLEPGYLPSRSGYSVVDPASPTVFVGLLPASGVLQAALPLDLLEGRQRAGLLFTQAKLYDPQSDTATLGAPSVLVQVRPPR